MCIDPEVIKPESASGVLEFAAVCAKRFKVGLADDSRIDVYSRLAFQPNEWRGIIHVETEFLSIQDLRKNHVMAPMSKPGQCCMNILWGNKKV